MFNFYYNNRVPGLVIVVNYFKIFTLNINYFRVFILSLLINFLIEVIDRIFI